MPITEIDGSQAEEIDNIQFGLNADRPVECFHGDMYVAIDKKWLWVCFIPNVWTRANAVDFTGAQASDYFSYDPITGFLIPQTGRIIRYGIDYSKSEAPVAGDVYVATDTQKVYYCFAAGTWTVSYIQKDSSNFEYDGSGDIMASALTQIFESDYNNDMMPTEDGTEDLIFEIVSNEITPKA